MEDDEQPKNIFKFGVIDNTPEEDDKDTIPQYDYVVVDTDGVEYDVNGFLIFTPHHLAIMTDLGSGAIPGLVLPIARVKTAILAHLIPDDDLDELPF